MGEGWGPSRVELQGPLRKNNLWTESESAHRNYADEEMGRASQANEREWEREGEQQGMWKKRLDPSENQKYCSW